MSDDVTAYMRWYVKDYLAAVMGLSAEERGAYSTLLAAMWANHGWLALDHDELPAICGVERKRWPKVWARIARYFIVNEDAHTFTNKRVQEERDAAINGRQKRSQAGSKGAAKRWQTDSNAIDDGMAMPSQTDGMDVDGKRIALNPSSVIRHPEIPPNPPPGGDEVAAPPEYPETFERIWADFPRVRGSKHEGYEAWRKLKPKPPVEAVLAGIAAWKTSREWTEDGGQYVPKMAKWLRARAWETPPPQQHERPQANPQYPLLG